MLAREPTVLCDLTLFFVFELFLLEIFSKTPFFRVVFFSFPLIFEICKTRVSFLLLKVGTSFFLLFPFL